MESVCGHIAKGRPRPSFLLALGKQSLPLRVKVACQTYELKAPLKHDFWAATAIYSGAKGDIVCKFHRNSLLHCSPVSWLGRWLARRERWFLTRFGHLPGVPGCGAPVAVDGRTLPNAVARPFVPGHPIQRGERLSEAFFNKLADLLQALHAGNAAYVDLNKRENVLVGSDGQPYLFDFQISFAIPRSHGWLDPLTWLLRVLQASDWYHFEKLRARHQVTGNSTVGERKRTRIPWWIRAHRWVAVPFREARRRLLVWLGVRTGKGRVTSEHFVEHGWRVEVS